MRITLRELPPSARSAQAEHHALPRLTALGLRTLSCATVRRAAVEIAHAEAHCKTLGQFRGFTGLGLIPSRWHTQLLCCEDGLSLCVDRAGFAAAAQNLVDLSVIAAVCLNYFFAPPLFELRIDALDDVSIAEFLTTSPVVSALTTGSSGRRMSSAKVTPGGRGQSGSRTSDGGSETSPPITCLIRTRLPGFSECGGGFEF